MSFKKHRRSSPSKLRVGVVVVSDSRAREWAKGKDTDVSGKIIEKILKHHGHESERIIIPDDRKQILNILRRFLREKDAIVFTGGTGITKRDITIETVEPLFEKQLPGFGEILRKIGYDRVGVPALLTRASAGIIKRKFVFCLPGAPNAVKIGMELVTPEMPHLVKHARE